MPPLLNGGLIAITDSDAYGDAQFLFITTTLPPPFFLTGF
jgi:hypothetical protein